ncbi:MAG: HisA/HisF-related TIM barrel protein [Cytophagales bacterium]|nr:HisA/HisF-related TIM barrel protein [Cytophagales bacterium]
MSSGRFRRRQRLVWILVVALRQKKKLSNCLIWALHQINIGSMAVQEPEKFSDWLKKYGPENFVLSADVKGENVSINGWLEDTKFRLFDLVNVFEKDGLEF